MDFLEGKGAEQVLNEYIEKEMTEYKKVIERDIAESSITPEAKAAFSRKPYYGVAGSFVKRPTVKK